MPDTETADPVVASLELYADRAGDPIPVIYQRFYAAHPDAEAEFAGDHFLEERMMGGVLQMLIGLVEGRYPPSQCSYWLSDHIAWEVTEEMVWDMFDAVVATIRDGLGAHWTLAMAVGWQDVIDQLRPVLHAGFTKN